MESLQHQVQDNMNKFLKSEWIKVYKANKRGYNNKKLYDYANVDWSNASLEDVLDFCVSGGEIGAVNAVEIASLLYTCEVIKPKYIVEIGRMQGRSTRMFATVAKKHSGSVLSIDGADPKGVLTRLTALKLQDVVELKKEWSPWVSFTPREIDLLFIDGDHSWISTVVDYHYFNFFVRKNGIIVFHDVNMVEVRDAIAAILKRDNLKLITTNSRVSIYQKTENIGEKYFQLLTYNKKMPREKLASL